MSSHNASPLAEPLPWNLVAEGYAEQTAPFFRAYAADALKLVAPLEGRRVLDVAAGPGTLSLLAARDALQVHGVDFSTSMIEQLEAARRAEGIDNLSAQVADGQNLPFEAATFDVAFSMFGLIFFPDRHRGLCELHRVLAPGGELVVSSWVPLKENPLLLAATERLADALGNYPLQPESAPLGEESAIREEFAAAGFKEIQVQRVSHRPPLRDADELYRSMERSAVPLVLLKHRLGEQWPAFAQSFRAGLQRTLRPELFERPWPALLTKARRSA